MLSSRVLDAINLFVMNERQQLAQRQQRFAGVLPVQPQMQPTTFQTTVTTFKQV